MKGDAAWDEGEVAMAARFSGRSDGAGAAEALPEGDPGREVSVEK